MARHCLPPDPHRNLSNRPATGELMRPRRRADEQLHRGQETTRSNREKKHHQRQETATYMQLLSLMVVLYMFMVNYLVLLLC